tara:strand:+ start:2238 stop:3008 length:771 start_codon:yes stop_codon:yes gene_type:complete
MHEAQLYEDNCFITLTFDEEHLPNDYSLNHDYFQKFMKRLRKEIAPQKVRYFMCGEYGDDSWRPHFHAILFNYNFPDKVKYTVGDSENPYFISEQLYRLWPYGFHLIGECAFDTAAYVARYCVKKITGDEAEAHYNRIITDWNEVTGEITFIKEVELTPEYARMSTNPGIGKDWYEKFKSDLYPSDFIVTNEGKKVSIPHYYDKLLEREDEYQLKQQKEARKMAAKLNSQETTRDRLLAREFCKKQQIINLKRNKQ